MTRARLDVFDPGRERTGALKPYEMMANELAMLCKEGHLRESDHLFYHHLAMYLFRRGGENPSVQEIADLAGKTRGFAYRSILRLERWGQIGVDRDLANRKRILRIWTTLRDDPDYRARARAEVEKERAKRRPRGGGPRQSSTVPDATPTTGPAPPQDGAFPSMAPPQDGACALAGRRPYIGDRQDRQETLRSLAREESGTARVEATPDSEPPPGSDLTHPPAPPVEPPAPTIEAGPVPDEPVPTPEQVAAWEAIVADRADRRHAAIMARLEAIGHLNDHRARLEARARAAAEPIPTPKVATLTPAGPRTPPPSAPTDHTAADCETLYRRLPSPSFRAEVPAIVEELALRLADRWEDWHSLGNHRKILRDVAAGTIPLTVALAAFKAGCSANGNDHRRLYQSVITGWRKAHPGLIRAHLRPD